VSYWTLEKRGELPISETDRRAMGTWIAGCDICQEVCPFNTKAAKAPTQDLVDGATSLQTWRPLLEESLEQYRARISDSALSRIKPAQFSRNLAIALGNAIIAAPDADWTPLKDLIEKRALTEADPVALSEWKRCLALTVTESATN
jgi:epoxyqueuosine reductase QueG